MSLEAVYFHFFVSCFCLRYFSLLFLTQKVSLICIAHVPKNFIGPETGMERSIQNQKQFPSFVTNCSVVFVLLFSLHGVLFFVIFCVHTFTSFLPVRSCLSGPVHVRLPYTGGSPVNPNMDNSKSKRNLTLISGMLICPLHLKENYLVFDFRINREVLSPKAKTCFSFLAIMFSADLQLT